MGGDVGALTTLRSVASRAHADQQPGAQAHALTALGASLLAVDDLEGAEAVLREALALQRSLDAPTMLLTPLAYLADLQQRRGQLAGALRTVDEILLILGDRQIGGVDDPLLVYAICVQVLRSTADPRADALARLGCQHLLHQGATHPDSPLSMRVRQWLGCT